ncbi:MAG: DsrE family protein [Campylobacterota bacterium]|nr:DsrE family protein [Campylobacterota bacterium]
MKKLILLMITSVFLFAEMKYADPKPSFENPRKWVIKLRSANIEKVNHMLGSIYNVLKVYPDEGIKIAVVTYAQGVRVLKKDYDPHTLSRITSLMDYEVEFIVCKNTMDTMKWTQEDFIDDLTYVQAGIAELIEKSADGWIEITPY